MKGRVKMFNEEKGYGFILGDDANDYFVHITEVKSVEALTRGAIVEFDPAETDKGKVARDVIIKEACAQRPTFVDFGSARIKLSNVKNYGISSATVYYAPVFKYVERTEKKQTLFGEKVKKTRELVDSGERIRLGETSSEAINKWKSDGMAEQIPGTLGNFIDSFNSRYYQYVKRDGELRRGYIDGSSKSIAEAAECKNVEYLYVTTFQNDNYRFFADVVDFDIHKKCRELDAYAI